MPFANARRCPAEGNPESLNRLYGGSASRPCSRATPWARCLPQGTPRPSKSDTRFVGGSRMSLPTNAARLLIADDDAAVRSVLREFLSVEYECESVGSAEEALSLLDGGDFQLIVSDI